LEAALTAAFVRLDAEIKRAVPDGTTASVVILKRAADGVLALVCCTRALRRALRRCCGGARVTLARNLRADAGAATSRPAGGVGVKCAWVGDSRAVLARYSETGGKTAVMPLTRDHKARPPAVGQQAGCTPQPARHTRSPGPALPRQPPLLTRLFAFRVAPLSQASDVMEAARIEAFYTALKRRSSSMHSDSDEGSVRRLACLPALRTIAFTFAHRA
jgi:serine/threonine protein phosphatase PrpC